MYSEEFYRVALHFVEGFGHTTLKKMILLSGTATEFFEHPEVWLTQTNRRSKSIVPPVITEALRRKVDAELRLMRRNDIQYCLCLDSIYPYRLRNCNDGPIAFFYKGSPCFNETHTLAVVGTREASEYGRNCVRKILSELRDYNVTTVSGLAYGVDTAAHTRSVENDMKTIAVLGSGFKTIYPQTNARLALQIVECGGSLISEYAFDVGPERMNFPKRNRIVAGLSDAILVVETANKGGSMITATIAMSYNRDVFAVPGTIFDPAHDGCHELIRNNAAAIATSGQDIVEMMNWHKKSSTSVQTALFVELNADEQCIVDVLRNQGGASIDVLTESFPSLSPSKLAGLLLTLELKGVVVCKPGKIYALASS